MENQLVEVRDNSIVISEDFRKKLIDFEKLKKEIEYQESVLKDELVNLMPQMGKERIILEGISISYRKGSTRTSFDSKAFKEDNPEEYEKYVKTSEVSPSVIIKVES